MSSSTTCSYVERGTQTTPILVLCNQCGADIPIDPEPEHIILSPGYGTEATMRVTKADGNKNKKGSYRVFSLPDHLRANDAQGSGLRVVSMPKVYRTRDRVPEDDSFDDVRPCIERSETFSSPCEWVTWMGSPPKPIPALHGPPSLPYARCPSGAEGIMVESDDIAPVVWGLRAKPGQASVLSISSSTKEHTFPSLAINGPTATTDIDLPQSSRYNDVTPDIPGAHKEQQQFLPELLGYIALDGRPKINMTEAIFSPLQMDLRNETSLVSPPLCHLPEKDMRALQFASYPWPSQNSAQHEYPLSCETAQALTGSLALNPSRTIIDVKGCGNHTPWTSFPDDHPPAGAYAAYTFQPKRETTARSQSWGSLSQDEALMGQLLGLNLSGIPNPLVTHRGRFGDKHDRKDRTPMLPANMHPVIEDNQAKSAEVRNYAKPSAGASEKENTQGKHGSKRKALRKFID